LFFLSCCPLFPAETETGIVGKSWEMMEMEMEMKNVYFENEG